MSWLHHLTGFQLFVITGFYDISLWQAEVRFERDHRVPAGLTVITSGTLSIFFTIWWFINAAWPVIS